MSSIFLSINQDKKTILGTNHSLPCGISIRMVGAFLSALLFCLVCTPYVLSYYLQVPLFVALFFFFITFIDFLNELLNNKFLLSVTFIFLIEFFYLFIGYSDAAIGNYVLKTIAFISVWAGVYLHKNCSIRTIRLLLFLFIAVSLINVVSNIYLGITISAYNSELAYLGDWGKINSGSFGFKYGIEFLSLISFTFVLKKAFPTKIEKVLNFTFFLFSFAFIVFFSLSATIIITYLSGIILLLFFTPKTKKKQTKSTKVFVFIGLLLLAFLFFIFFADKIIEYSYSLLGDKIGDRVRALFDVSRGTISNDDSSILTRFDLIKDDLSFLVSSPKSFIFGNGYHTYKASTVSSYSILNKSGGHSELFDYLAQYGVFGFFVFITALTTALGYFKRFGTYKTKSVIRVIIFVFLFNSIFNIFYHPLVFFVLVFFVPITLTNSKQL